MIIFLDDKRSHFLLIIVNHSLKSVLLFSVKKLFDRL